jgi:hypothetical protein
MNKINGMNNSYSIAKNDKPEKFISDITNQDNIGFLMTDGGRIVVVEAPNNCYAIQGSDGKIVAIPHNEARKQKRTAVMHFRDNHDHELSEIRGFDTPADVMDWAFGKNDSPDVIYK